MGGIVNDLRDELAEKARALQMLKSRTGGFRLGEGKFAQKEAQRRREEIKELKKKIADPLVS